jgi:hypothetical protein
MIGQAKSSIMLQRCWRKIASDSIDFILMLTVPGALLQCIMYHKRDIMLKVLTLGRFCILSYKKIDVIEWIFPFNLIGLLFYYRNQAGHIL